MKDVKSGSPSNGPADQTEDLEASVEETPSTQAEKEFEFNFGKVKESELRPLIEGRISGLQSGFTTEREARMGMERRVQELTDVITNMQKSQPSDAVNGYTKEDIEEASLDGEKMAKILNALTTGHKMMAQELAYSRQEKRASDARNEAIQLAEARKDEGFRENEADIVEFMRRFPADVAVDILADKDSEYANVRGNKYLAGKMAWERLDSKAFKREIEKAKLKAREEGAETGRAQTTEPSIPPRSLGEEMKLTAEQKEYCRTTNYPEADYLEGLKLIRKKKMEAE